MLSPLFLPTRATLRDWRERRDWKRIWRDPAGFFRGCDCQCNSSSAPSSSQAALNPKACCRPINATLHATLIAASGCTLTTCTGLVGLTVTLNYKDNTAGIAACNGLGLDYWTGQTTISGVTINLTFYCNQSTSGNSPSYNLCVQANGCPDTYGGGTYELRFMCTGPTCSPLNIPFCCTSASFCTNGVLGCAGVTGGTFNVVVTN